MLRRLFSRSFFCNRREGENGTNLENRNYGIRETNFVKFRIGWWPVIAERDQALIDALVAGRFRLLHSADRDIDWAYAACEVGPLHTEIVRWHFPTGRWFRMPKILDEDNSSDWCIRWRPLPRPPSDLVSGVAQGPFQNWDVLAGEMDSESNQLSAAVVLRTTRTNKTSIASTNIFSLIAVSELGRNKQGYLLSPAPDDGRKGGEQKSISYHVAYRRQVQELNFFFCNAEAQLIIWHRYKQRGRRVYWLVGKQEIKVPDSFLFSRRIFGLRDADLFRLVTGLGPDDICVEFNLEKNEWLIVGADMINSGGENGSEYPDVVQTIGSPTRDKGSSQPVPVLQKFNTPFTLRWLSAQTILHFAHPRYLNNPAALVNALPPDRFVLQTVNRMLIHE